ncbi:hypothetical protein AOLI_G00107190 [Acnodon oligacanthus]
MVTTNGKTEELDLIWLWSAYVLNKFWKKCAHSDMAYSSGIVSEEQLLCCICLDVFTDPVSTPCGHNFCKKCLGGYWDNSDHWHCPLCNKSFENRPDLSVNTFISETAAQFRQSAELNASSSAENNPSKLTKVLCDACTGVKKKAVKSCLNCGASYCGAHLAPHKNVQILQKHKLTDPVENLEHYICKKHERPLELFCRDDQICVCLFCTEGDHKTHNTVPIEEASGELEDQRKKIQTLVQKMIQDRLEKTEEIKHSVELSKKSTDDKTASGVEVFTALIRSIERSQAELLEVMDEKQKAAERQAEDLIKELEQEITELQIKDTELDQLSNVKNNLQKFQVYPSLCRPPHTKSWTNIRLNTHSSEEILRRSLSQLQTTLNDEMDKEIQKLKQTCQQKEADWRVVLLIILPLVVLVVFQSYNLWLLFYAVDVTLDPDTANNYLIVSADGKQVRHSGTWLNVPYKPKRFRSDPYVLAKEGFSSGRFYYEVQVSGKTDWDVGVARESIDRWWKVYPSAKHGTWTVILRNGNEYYACAVTCVMLSLKQKPQKVGVFVDYEEGLVSFYDVEVSGQRCPIYSFTDHKTHSTVPIEEESRKTKTQLGLVQAKVQWMIHERLKKLQKIKHSLEISKRNTEKEKADSVDVFAALIRSIERSQAELTEVMEEKQKAAERQAEDLIKELEQEITELKKRDTELEQLSHTEDHLQLLQIYPSLCTPPYTKNWTDINFEPYQSAEPARHALSQLQKSLNEKLYEAVFREMKRSNEYAVNVMLDADTAHPNLILSDDGKQVRHTCRQQNRPDDSQRFDTCCNVLGKEGFFSDRFYYEVQVRDKTDWVLGVSRESIKRKGMIKLSPENGFWTVSLRKGNKYDANDITLVPLYLREKLQKIYPSLCRPPHTKSWTDISIDPHSHVEILRRSLSQLQKTINNETEKEIQKLTQRRQKEAAGVAEESVDRFEEFPHGTWTIALWNGNEYKACEGFCKSLSLREKPQKVGAFVDYEEGLVSFYDVEARSHIYSFTGQSFTEKLYPFLGPCHVPLEHGNSAPLIISKEYQSYTWKVFRQLG